MAKWWKLGVIFPERNDEQFFQLYADTEQAATSLAHTLFVKMRAIAPDENVGIRTLGSSDTWFDGVAQITTEGIKGAPGSVEKKPPVVEKKPPDGKDKPSTLHKDLPPEDLYNASLLRGLAERIGVTAGGLGNSIAGRGALQNAPAYENVFGFRERTSGTDPADPLYGRNDALQHFVRDTSPAALSREAMAQWRRVSGQEAGTATPEQRQSIQSQYGNPNDESATYLAQLAAEALRSRYSPLALRGMRMPTGQSLRTSFIADTGGDPEDDFIQYLRQNYPLLAGI